MRKVFVGWSLALGWLVGAWLAPAAATVPAGFTDSLVASPGGVVTALDYTHDGRWLVTIQSGTLRVIQNNVLLATPAFTFPTSSICNEGERGLLGVAVHPSFETNHFIYLYYTFETGSTPACVNRVSRFTLPDSNVINAASELVLVDNMPSPGCCHNAGDVQFGKDGFLYVSIGEGGNSSAARLEHILTGKILRIADDGSIPATNPFQGAGTARCNVTGSTTPGNKCQETFAWGFRNPFRIAFDSNAVGTRFFINDVGAGRWEEVDLAVAGADYGWDLCEGAHDVGSDSACSSPPPGWIPPVFEYRHGVAIPGTTAADFGSSLGGVVHLRFGPNDSGSGGRALHYTTTGGQVRRISTPAPAGPADDFFSIAPCRAVDTRLAPGPLGGPAILGGATRTFLLAGACGVPATAHALAVNVTAISPSVGGHLTLFPAGSGRPATSTINFGAGQTRSNNAVVRLSPEGAAAVFYGTLGGGGVHFVLDVVGYFE
jgi:glucose/arabinose dehydrogenase